MKFLIAGLAKTGTTGMLYLIVNSLEKQPKILFEPRECPANLHGDGDVIAKILIGSPGLDTESFASFEKKVIIVRDPRDRMISGLLYSQFHANYLDNDAGVNSVKALLKRKEVNPASVSLRELLGTIGSIAGVKNSVDNNKRAVERSLARFDEFVETNSDGLLYKYEDFVSGDFSVLEKYLEFPVTGKAEVPAHFQRVARTKGYGDWRNWFTDEDIEDYQTLINPWLQKYGYDAEDWKLNPTPLIDSTHCSEYFMRLVREHREKGTQSNDISVQNDRSPVLKGRISRAEPTIVAGWAIGTEVEEPVSVALLVDGIQIAQVKANRLRPAIKRKNIHPTGECGFVFRFKPNKALPVGTEVAVQSTSSGVGALRNSPCIICEPSENRK